MHRIWRPLLHWIVMQWMQQFIRSTRYVTWLLTLSLLLITSIWIWTCGLHVGRIIEMKWNDHQLFFKFSLISLDGLFEKLSSIPASQLNEDRIAFVLPAFQFTPNEREICKTDNYCFDKLSPKLPTTKAELLKCIRMKVCQIANGFLPTHVWSDRLIYYYYWSIIIIDLLLLLIYYYHWSTDE